MRSGVISNLRGERSIFVYNVILVGARSECTSALESSILFCTVLKFFKFLLYTPFANNFLHPVNGEYINNNSWLHSL